MLSLSGAIGGGVTSILIFLEAPQGLVLPECHCEVELGMPGWVFPCPEVWHLPHPVAQLQPACTKTSQFWKQFL